MPSKKITEIDVVQTGNKKSPGPVEIWNQPIKGSLVPEPSKRENLKSLIYSELITNRACSETVGYALHKIMKAVDAYAYELSKDTADDMPTDEETEDMRWKV